MKKLRLIMFGATASESNKFFSTIFCLVCIGLGHNTFERLYGQTAVFVLTLTAAAKITWFLPDEITESSVVKRLT